MLFGQRLKKLRTDNKMTQEQLANKLGISKRTLINYEKGNCYPKSTEVFSKLSEIFMVSVDFLMMDSTNKYNATIDSKQQAASLISEFSALFSGGKLEDTDKDAVMQALMDAYWDAKKSDQK